VSRDPWIFNVRGWAVQIIREKRTCIIYYGLEQEGILRNRVDKTDNLLILYNIYEYYSYSNSLALLFVKTVSSRHWYVIIMSPTESII